MSRLVLSTFEEGALPLLFVVVVLRYGWLRPACFLPILILAARFYSNEQWIWERKLYR